MSQFTNYGENKLADFFRGQGLTLPTNWYMTPLSAYSDSSATELTGVGLSRVSVARSLANFAGTQADASTTASSGTSHVTSNNNAIAFGTASGSGTLVAVGLFDAASGGNCWMVWELDASLPFVTSDSVGLTAAQLRFSLGLTNGCTDYLANKLIDLIFRAQAFSWPATIYHGAFTAAPSNAGDGTEVGGDVGYTRASLVPSTANISGTQSVGSTTASSGTAGRISNNVSVAHPQPTGSWGSLGWGGWFDAATSGNLLFWHALTASLTVDASSSPPTYAPNGFGLTIA